MRRSVMVLVILIVAIVAANASAQFSLGQPPSEQIVRSNLASQPLCFTENRGQWDEKALFKAEAGGATFWYCKDEVVYQFTRDTDELMEDAMPHGPDMPEGMPDKFNRPRYKQESMVLRAQFVGANPNAEIIREDRLSHNNNYFIGNDPSKWATDVPNYSSITYKDIYPGIDLRYHGNGHGMKYDFIVNPGADISQIRIRYEGADNLFISNAGDLEAQTRFGLVYENIPEIYQEKNGAKVSVSGSYQLIESGIFGFAVNGYNPSLALIIDPELVYSTYLGGNNTDKGLAIAVDGSGNAYVTGYTYSTDFPTQNPYQTDQGSYDAFATKLSPSGNSLVYSTYLGGNGDDYGNAITVDGSGNAYLTGWTESANFPTVNPYSGSLHGVWRDVFVTKLSASGNSLIYSTYIGGSLGDEGYGIAVDGSGNAYVTGRTPSSNFPTVNPYDGSYNSGGSDGFVLKLNASGNALIYSTFLGGSGGDACYGITIDGSGSAYITGYTSSSNFPTQNPYQIDQAGSDAFVTKLSPAGNSLAYSTYLGGDSDDMGNGIAVDGSGNAYVTGYTNSTNFPTQNPYQIDQTGSDAFVTKLSPAGNSLAYSTYLGGNGGDVAYGIAVDGLQNAHIIGYTSSSDFPTMNPYNGNYNGGSDVFISKLAASGSELAYSTYVGGSGNDYGFGIAVNSLNDVYAIGCTYSSNFPTAIPYDGTLDGSSDAFVLKFGTPTTPCIHIDTDSLYFMANQNGPSPSSQNFVISNTGIGTLNWSITDNASWLDETPLSGDNNNQTITVSTNTTNLSQGVYNATISVASSNANNSPQNVNIQYLVSAAPHIVIDVTEIEFGTTIHGGELPTSESFQITNGGGSSLHWAISDANMDWLDETPLSGNDNQLITASVNTSVLEPRTHSATITVTSDNADNSPQIVEVSYVIIPDFVPPLRINDLSLSENTSTSVILSWTATGDDNSWGTASEYDIRYSPSDVTSNWESAIQVTGEPIPLISGTQQSMIVHGLALGVSYCFAMKVKDDENNWSGLSNTASRFGFRPVPSGWNFANNDNNMWPQGGDFPTWELFRDAFGISNTEDGAGNRLEHAVEWFNYLKDPYGGSCFGFSISSLLIFDSYIPLSNYPYDLNLNDEIRHAINVYQLYQFGKNQRQHRNAIRNQNPNQTWDICNQALNDCENDDIALDMWDRSGNIGHTIVPYRVESPPNPDWKYIYVYDNNYPGDDTKKITIDIPDHTWYYDGRQNSGSLIQSLPISSFTSMPLLPTINPPTNPLKSKLNTDDSASYYMQLYVTPASSTQITSSLGSIGVVSDSFFSTLTDGSPIIPIDDQATIPIGYFLPNDNWNCQFSALKDSVFMVSVFAAHTVMTYSRFNVDTLDIESFRYVGNDSAFWVYNLGSSHRNYQAKTIALAPDSEIVCHIADIGIGPEDSVLYSITSGYGMSIRNFGDSTVYTAHIKIFSGNRVNEFYHTGISIESNTRQDIIPDWREFRDSLKILIDPGMTGAFTETLLVQNDSTSMPSCEYVLGDINSNGSVIGSDVTYGVRYFKGMGTPPPDSCYNDSVNTLTHWLYVAGDVNGDCKFMGSDITRLVAYFKGNAQLEYCHFFPAPPMRKENQTPISNQKD